MAQEDFKTGFEHGMGNLQPEGFEGFIGAEASESWLEERMKANQVRLDELERKTDQFKNNQKPVYAQFIGKKAELEATDLERHGLLREVEKLEQEKQEALDLKKERHTHYALLAGILYLLAGIAFVAGDLIISHEIVAYALNIRNTFEAWAFAVGLASLSILLKPAYERLVERPYLEKGATKLYNAFQGALIVFAVGTLIILGWFRYEAYKTDKLKEAINREVKSLQLESTSIDPSVPVDDTALMQKIETKLRAYDQLNLDLVNSPWALLSFVLSGVLFAIAGAICLGIAFPILQCYWYRGLQMNPKIRRCNRRLKKLAVQKSVLDNKYQKVKAEYENFQNHLDLLGHVDEIRAERAELLKQNSQMLDLLKNSKSDKRVYAFKHGYAAGQKKREEMTDEEYEGYRKQELTEYKKAEREEQSRQAKPPVLRPHLALRKVISDNFGEN
ncbi:hypothetical protein LAG90_07070 [Marinilongibacter aquaticus]|uniref:hypothetical protein n=1 Tax=Marinilongibacter aquaticus TaxID=2975157 RepID=UPI0021BDB8FE|nr:hypothetical protein [Marinilongibacter aquaticus]UBM60404.1 hypothetical protein LAG90_07070 [Marinilongibacter aquaticus]